MHTKTVDGVILENEVANNTFFMQNVFKTRYSNPYYKAFDLFITKVFKDQNPDLEASYNRAINILMEEDQIITDTLIFLYNEKDLSRHEQQYDINDYHLEELEKGYNFIVEQIKQY